MNRHLLLTLIALLTIAAQSTATSAAQAVQLAESRAISLPHGAKPRVITVIDSTTAIVALADSSYIVKVVATGLIRIPVSSEYDIVGIAFSPKSGFEFVDAASNQVVVIDEDGRTKPRRAISFPVRIETAVKTGREWFIGALTSDSVFEIWRGSEAGKGKPVARIPPDDVSRELRRLPAAHLAIDRDALIVASALYPFSVTRVDKSGTSVRFDPPTSSRQYVRWNALAAIPISTGYLQTIADPTSDNRLLIHYDRRGKILRQVIIEAPLGLAASLTAENGHDVVVGVRTLRKRELVFYTVRISEP